MSALFSRVFEKLRTFFIARVSINFKQTKFIRTLNVHLFIDKPGSVNSNNFFHTTNNSADGNYEVTLMTKATLKYTGEVSWKPPAIYKSSCEINVEYFPFDEQSCYMKFGSWTYNGAQVDLKHMEQEAGMNIVAVGIDLTDFYLSVEWDILEVPASRNEEYDQKDNTPYSGEFLFVNVGFYMQMDQRF